MEPHSKREVNASQTPDDPATAIELENLKTPVPIQEAPVSTTEEPRTFFQTLTGLFRGNGSEVELDENQAVPLKETLQSLLKEHDKNGHDIVIVPEERTMLRNILRFGEMDVSDIMIPRPDIVAVEYGISEAELKQFIVREQHSRIPVFNGNLDTVSGFIHIKDVAVSLFSGNPFNMDDAIRQILFVPPSMKVMDLLIKMRRSSTHIAIVIDEYGGTDGLVSMEDIMEEIVGEIQDEHDEEEMAQNYTRISDRIIEVDGRMEIDELEAIFGPDMVLHEDEEEVDTVGGLVFSHLGHVPETGEEFDYPTGLRITVLEAEPRAVKRLRIEKREAIAKSDNDMAAAK